MDYGRLVIKAVAELFPIQVVECGDEAAQEFSNLGFVIRRFSRAPSRRQNQNQEDECEVKPSNFEHG
jgi:hypothetical protein